MPDVIALNVNLSFRSKQVKWRELLITLRRLEDRGEVRGGRFVSGFLGEQFALPVAVESLRATRHQQPSGETIIVSAADPLNFVGIVVPGDRVAANSGKLVAFRDGIAVPPDERTSVLRMPAPAEDGSSGAVPISRSRPARQ